MVIRSLVVPPSLSMGAARKSHDSRGEGFVSVTPSGRATGHGESFRSAMDKCESRMVAIKVLETYRSGVSIFNFNLPSVVASLCLENARWPPIG